MFFVPGVPVAQGSKRHLGNGVMVESSKRLPSWRHDVRQAAADAFTEPLGGPVDVEIVAIFDRPKGHYGTGRNAEILRTSAPRDHITKPDVDKLVRAILDALTKIAWHDDRQVIDLRILKRYAINGEAGREIPGAQITVSPTRIEETP